MTVKELIELLQCFPPDAPVYARLDEVADEIERLQAKIDALMLEHCPDEMTPEQLAEWAKHQRPSAEPSGCPEHGMEHFFEGMCIKCGVVPAAKSTGGLVPAGLVDAKCVGCGKEWKINTGPASTCMVCGGKLKFTLTAVKSGGGQ